MNDVISNIKNISYFSNIPTFQNYTDCSIHSDNKYNINNDLIDEKGNIIGIGFATFLKNNESKKHKEYQKISEICDLNNDSLSHNNDGHNKVGVIAENNFLNIYIDKDEKIFNNKNKENIINQNYYNASLDINHENKELERISNLNISKNKIRKIFNIIKINKKVGRIKKNSMMIGKHNRLSGDNIIRKIKARFLEKLRKYINIEYTKYVLGTNKKKNTNWLKKINPELSRKIKIEENLKWFQSKISDIFSENVSSRYSSHSSNYNKKKIEHLLILNEAKTIIEILTTKVEVMYDKYIKNEEIEGFKTLRDDINELREQLNETNKDNIAKYLNKYEYVAKNMKQIFESKIPRNKKLYEKFKN